METCLFQRHNMQQMLRCKWSVFSISMFSMTLQILPQQPYRLCHGTKSEEEDWRTTLYQEPIIFSSDPLSADAYSHIEATDHRCPLGLKHPKENEAGASSCPHP